MLALALTPLRQTGPSAWPSFSFPGGESSPAHSHHRFAATHSEHRASLFAATATNPEHRASLRLRPVQSIEFRCALPRASSFAVRDPPRTWRRLSWDGLGVIFERRACTAVC